MTDWLKVIDFTDVKGMNTNVPVLSRAINSAYMQNNLAD